MQVGLEIAQTQCICLAWERSRPEFNFPPTGVMKSKKASKQASNKARKKQAKYDMDESFKILSKCIRIF